MATRKRPATAETKQEEPKEEPKQIEVKEEQKELEYSIKVNPDLYERMMKIGSQEFWQHVLENYYHELAKRYRR
jgi:hypothetical protein